MEDVPFGKFGFIKKQSIDWIKTHLSSSVAISVVIIGSVWVLSKTIRIDNQADYLKADLTYQNWDGSKNRALSKLQKIIQQHPELHSKYDGGIAQKLLSSSENSLANRYASAVWKRIKYISPYHTTFSECSLLIADGKYEQALLKSKELKLALEKDEDFWLKKSELVRHGCILYAFNLLRIATLENVAGTPSGELSAWRELKESAGWLGSQYACKRYDPEAYTLIQENFQNQDISLLDYINHREVLLSISQLDNQEPNE